MERPEWWGWPLGFTAHAELRMEERGFSETELRAMLEDASALEPSRRPGRWIVRSQLADRPWVVIVEPDPDERMLMVVTAYPRTV